MTDSVTMVADIGGTHARFAVADRHYRTLRHIKVVLTKDHSTLFDAIDEFLAASGVGAADSICIAVASPIEDDVVDLPNNHWSFRRSELADRYQAKTAVINDFTAQALSLSRLQDREFVWLTASRPGSERVQALVGPGTGLGVAAVLPDGGVVPSEGGHVAFAPQGEHQSALLGALEPRFGRVSYERLLSGMGIANLYWANAVIGGDDIELPAEQVADHARAGEPLAVDAIRDFFSILAAYAGDTVLMMGATGGCFLAGGILPKIRDLMDVEAFLRVFSDKGRYSDYCAAVPVGIIVAEHPGLLGCLAHLELSQ